jgi:hypothetical protein
MPQVSAASQSGRFNDARVRPRVSKHPVPLVDEQHSSNSYRVVFYTPQIEKEKTGNDFREVQDTCTYIKTRADPPPSYLALVHQET